jgi:high-affinity iron transporter
MLASFLLSLREGLEAALIIGIVLGALFKLNRAHLNRMVWIGVGAAVIVSVIVAIALDLLGMEFEGTGEQIFEGAAMLLAAGILTWMILWMRKSAPNLKNELEAKTNEALRSQGGKAIFMLAFLAVVREGIELALFLLAVQKASSPMQTLIGALAGLAGAAALGWVLFKSARKMSLRGFFQATNVLLIIFAAGLVAMGVHEFNEAGVIPAVIEHVWDLNWILSAESELGLLLKALVGYNPSPSLTEVIAYLAYLSGIMVFVSSRKQQEIPLVASPAD